MEVIENRFIDFEFLNQYSSLWYNILYLRRLRREIDKHGKVDEAEEKRSFEWFQQVSILHGATFATLQEFRAFYRSLVI